jgi:hypothetical protein
MNSQAPHTIRNNSVLITTALNSARGWDQFPSHWQVVSVDEACKYAQEGRMPGELSPVGNDLKDGERMPEAQVFNGMGYSGGNRPHLAGRRA